MKTEMQNGIEVVGSMICIPSEKDFKRLRNSHLDFREIPASTGIYGIHPYPAMLHFLVVRKLIQEFSHESALVLDPFVGSGVVAGECLISNRNFIGYDINHLAVLIAKVRTSPLRTGQLMNSLQAISNDFARKQPQPVDFPNILYWFDKDVIDSLSRLRQAIFSVRKKLVVDFFKVAFSETVRRVSKTRFNEFKLLRKKNCTNNSNLMRVFRDVSLKNIGLLSTFYRNFVLGKVDIELEERNILDGIPIEDNSIDLVLTSPPYGDSKTTVAYGQFSRLSLRWLGLEERVDKTSLGGKPKDISKDIPSAVLYKFLDEIARKDEKRAREVFSFYDDLYNSIQIVARKVKRGGYVCFIVGNRRVKGIELPTDKISADFFEHEGFRHEKTLVRAISSKRMPAENSPSNIKGQKDSTMKYEYIVILKKDGSRKHCM